MYAYANLRTTVELQTFEMSSLEWFLFGVVKVQTSAGPGFGGIRAQASIATELSHVLLPGLCVFERGNHCPALHNRSAKPTDKATAPLYDQNPFADLRHTWRFTVSDADPINQDSRSRDVNKASSLIHRIETRAVLSSVYAQCKI